MLVTAMRCLFYYLFFLSLVFFKNYCNGRNYSNTTVIWEQVMEETSYSSVGIISSSSIKLDDSDSGKSSTGIQFTAATWQNKPKFVELLSPDSKNGSATWKYQLPNSLQRTPSTLAVVTAQHIDSNSSGPVDFVVATHIELNSGETGSNMCTLSGFNSRLGSDMEAVWTYNVTGNCSVDLTLEGDSKSVLKFSDDGSTVAFAVFVFYPLTHTTTPQLHCIDGQTGNLIFLFEGDNLGPSSVSLSRDGERIAYSNGLVINVLQKSTGQLLTKPLVRQMVSDVQICPMGIFLLYAINDGSVIRRWNETTGQFQITPYQPTTPAGEPNTWIAVSHSTSVNGKSANPSGCLAAVGWLGMGPNQGIAKLEVFSMLTGEVYIQWTSSSKGSGLQNFPVIAMHLGYTALGIWGNYDHKTSMELSEPNIFLFHTDFGNHTVMEYTSQGSVIAIDMVNTPYSLPGLDLAHDDFDGKESSVVQTDVYIISASKLGHATIPNRGGECLAFKIPVQSRPMPPLII